MDEKLENIIRDIEDLDASLKEKEGEIRKITRSLMEHKPVVPWDRNADRNIKQSIRDSLEKRKRIIPFKQKKGNWKYIWLAASLILAFVISGLFIFNSLSSQSSLTLKEEKSVTFFDADDQQKETVEQTQTTTETEETERDEDSMMQPPEKPEDFIEYSDTIEEGEVTEDIDNLESGLEEQMLGQKDKQEVLIPSTEDLLSNLSFDDTTTYKEFNTEEYDRIYENEFVQALTTPVSTVSIDVDTASYSNVRRYINSNSLPPKDAVRIEELINYFEYDYPDETGEHPFSIWTQVSVCPWNQEHLLLHIGLQGKTVLLEDQPPSNLVFLIDVSGSMADSNKLPLLINGFHLLVNELGRKDTVSIVVYAGAAGLVLPPTSGRNKDKILDALSRLDAGGSTAGGEGILLAYKTAGENFIDNGNNRIILATDGDFNVGITSDADLTRLIEEKRDEGIFLTVLGFGTGNYKDSKMETLADTGNGNYFYIDNIREAEKVLVTELSKTIFTIAKDVKVQIEFNPGYIDSYRLIGYENRILQKEDFDDDTKDAGEIGAGHTVTFLYEIIPAEEILTETELRYQTTELKEEAQSNNEIAYIKLRYKFPDADESILFDRVVPNEITDLSLTTDDFRFAASVAEWGLLLRDSEFKGDASLEQVLELARDSLGEDQYRFRDEFIDLVETSILLFSLQIRDR
jgi:Ca-activated chloride channel family protein